MTSSHTHRTTLVIGNIHCPSCVSKIESILESYESPIEKHHSSARSSLGRVVNSLSPGHGRSRSTSPNSTLVNDIEENKHSEPEFSRVNVSPLNGTVSFNHSPDTRLEPLIAELEDAGFDVVQTDATDPGSPPPRGGDVHRTAPTHSTRSPWSRFSDLFASSSPKTRLEAHKENCGACRAEEAAQTHRSAFAAARSHPPHTSPEALRPSQSTDPSTSHIVEGTFSIDGMTCASCTSAIESALSPQKTPGIISVRVLLVDNSATVVYDPDKIKESDIIQHIEDVGYDAKAVSKKPASPIASQTGSKDQPNGKPHAPRQTRLYRVNLSIGGMTCASCVNTITNMLKNLKGVKESYVDLMGNSGYAIVEDEDLASTIESEIEDLGYEAKIMSVEPVIEQFSSESEEPDRQPRVTHVKIEGFFCEHCPAKANQVLEDLSKRFRVTFTPSTLNNPVSTLTYMPNPPDFTLRTIRRAITELGFTISVVKPETLQDRAKLAQSRERKRILIRLGICTIFCIPTFIIGVVFASLLPEHNRTKMYWHQPIWGGASRITVALFALATPIQFGIGQFFYERAYKSLRGVWRKRKGKVDMKRVWIDRLLRWGSMDTLVALGSTIAWASSLAYMILDIKGRGTGEMAYFDTSVFLMTFILAGRYLESISKARTGDAIAELSKLRPKKGFLYHDEKPIEEVESDFIEVGDKLLVPVGMSPPVDCVVAEGSSSTSFDEASLTGESRPVGKKTGDTIYAGTYNMGPSAAIVVTTTHDGETVIDSIALGVRDAMSKKAGIERFADAVTAIFVPFIVGVSCLVFALWMIRAYAGGIPEDWLDNRKTGGWSLFALQFTVACLIVACPCGIGLAAPTAQYVGIGLAARNGIMPNGGGEAFQSFTHIDAIAFDKTGTITMGKFQVSDDRLFGIVPPATLWGIVSVVEQASNHPVARAIFASAQERITSAKTDNITKQPKVLDMQEVPGRGMKATIELPEGTNCEALVGNEKLLSENDCEISNESSRLLQRWQGQGKSIVLVAVKMSHESSIREEEKRYRVAALLAVADPLRPEARFVLDYFRSKLIATYIVSGDSPATVKAVARVLNLPESHVVGGALPEDKRRFVADLQNQTKEVRGWNGKRQRKHKLVAFVGDGINDSIALAQADVSIAQGGGSQAAASTADFALLTESLLSIITLQAIARATYRRIISNFCWACIYNIVLIPLAAGAFYDLGRTKLPAVWASLAMALSSVSVVMNSLLLRYTFRVPREVKQFREQC